MIWYIILATAISFLAFVVGIFVNEMATKIGDYQVRFHAMEVEIARLKTK